MARAALDHAPDIVDGSQRLLAAVDQYGVVEREAEMAEPLASIE